MLDYGPNRELPPGTGGTGCGDCDDHNPCTDDACKDGACTNEPLADVDLPSEDEQSDCQRAQCACGVIAQVPDDDDVPPDEDENPCTEPACSQGVTLPERTLPRGTACNDGKMCDGAAVDPQCVECLAASDCSGTLTCGTWKCNGGKCEIEPVDVAIADNCQSEACTDGSFSSTPDDSDVPDDPDDPDDMITSDGCLSGAPKFVYAKDCAGDGDCPADVPPCTDWSCDLSTFKCTRADTSAAVLVQSSGDCLRQTCTSDGLLALVTDDDDDPPDLEQCRRAECRQGQIVQVPRARNTSCDVDDGHFCNGDGSCVDCTEDGQCPAGDCELARCISGLCHVSFAPADSLASEQVDGDCLVAKCDGQGHVTQVAQPFDVPDDGNACTCDACGDAGPEFTMLPPGTDGCDCIPEGCGTRTCGLVDNQCGALLDCGGQQEPDGTETDIDCGGAIATCATRCGNGDNCNDGSDCASGYCADGVCCNSPCADLCEACDESPNEGKCVLLENDGATDPECGGGGQCNGFGECAQGLGYGCMSPLECASGYCEDHVCCEEECEGACWACDADGMCAALAKGEEGDCPAGWACDGSGACLKEDGEDCGDDADECLSMICQDEYCCQAACPDCKDCNFNGQCFDVPRYEDECGDETDTMTCNGMGLCKLVNGESCGTGDDCASGNCVDTVCCANGCVGEDPNDCWSCNVPGFEGSCATQPAGTTCDLDPMVPESCCGSLCQDSVMVCSTMQTEVCVETFQAEAGGGDVVTCP